MVHHRRAWACAALALVAAAAVLAVRLAIERFPRGLLVLVCLALAVAAGWNAVRRRGTARQVGLIAAAALLAGALLLILLEGKVVLDLLVAALFAGAVASARMAFRVHQQLPEAPPPRQPVLFYNPVSGGGKAERLHLADEARKRHIEPIELQRGDDLELLVRAAVDRGADGLAMAGGDGSQAIVAMVAAERDLPYACIPAGTRNHFALDLGVDRTDVVGALDAFVDGGERRVDLAEVNGRVFVNNVSLGLYAEAVQRDGYREAKIRTIVDAVPDVAGPDAEPPSLHWSGPDGEGAGLALLVSNNRYRLGKPLSSGTRPRLDAGALGINVIAPDDSRGATRLLATEQWARTQFAVESDRPVPAGIDGEAAVLEPPLDFRVRPGALRVRIARRHPGASPSALIPDSAGQTFAKLAHFAFAGDDDGREP
jgi:diacylglycerol kinase family enzyme